MSDKKTLSETSAAYKIMKPFIIGGLAACGATTCVQPIDMVKVRIQLAGESAGSSKNPFAVAKNLIAQDGFFSLYRGLSAALLRQLTYGTTRLGIFRTMTNHFEKEKPMTMYERVGCSLVAGGLGALIGTPADAALVRMQADTLLPPAERRGYKNAIDAMIRMLREEGLKGFFSGASPTIYRGLSINVGMLATYDPVVIAVKPTLNNDILTALVAGSVSGFCAATVSLPFDFIKTRLQKQKPAKDGSVKYKSFFDCATKVMKEEGTLALYSGYPTYIFRIAPHIMLTWLFMFGLGKVECLK